MVHEKKGSKECSSSAEFPVIPYKFFRVLFKKIHAVKLKNLVISHFYSKHLKYRMQVPIHIYKMKVRKVIRFFQNRLEKLYFELGILGVNFKLAYISKFGTKGMNAQQISSLKFYLNLLDGYFPGLLFSNHKQVASIFDTFGHRNQTMERIMKEQGSKICEIFHLKKSYLKGKKLDFWKKLYNGILTCSLPLTKHGMVLNFDIS